MGWRLFLLLIAKTAASTWLDCDHLLAGPQARLAQRHAARLFASGEVADDRAAVLIGVAAGQMVRLMNQTMIKSVPGAKIRPRLVATHAAVRDFLRNSPSFEGSAAAFDAQMREAQEDAWVASVVEVLASRPCEYPVPRERFATFLREIWRARRAERTTDLDHVRVARAARQAEYPRRGSTPALLFHALVCQFGLLSRVQLRGLDALRSVATGRVRDLPKAAGFVLALNPDGLFKIDWTVRQPPYVKRVVMRDVVGVEPLDLPEFRFMDQVKARVGVK